MERYKNLGGDSGVHSYETGINFIRVQFHDGGVYKYDNICPGEYHVNNMKALAKTGEGLNEYINKYVRKNYPEKER